MGVRHWLTLVFSAEILFLALLEDSSSCSFPLCDRGPLGHLLLNVLQEFVVGRRRLRPILHQVLEESSFS